MRNNTYIEGTFYSKWFSKFINHWFFSGVNFQTEKLFYLSFFFFKSKLNCCPLFFFFEALEKIKPFIGLKLYKKKHKKNKIVKVTAIPYFFKLPLQYKKGIFWLAKASQLRVEKNLIQKIVNELYSINILNSGESLKKKMELYKYAVLFKTTKRFKW